MVTLESSALFNQLPATELRLLEQAARTLRFGPGQDIFRAGEPGDGAYLVKSGSVQISAILATGQRCVFSRVPPGEIFGEMTLLDDQPRSASASAEGETEVLFMPREAMADLLRRSPEFAVGLVREISGRLRAFDQQYLREVVQAERMAVVGRFASAVVHDLKNPLSVIDVASELMALPEASSDDRAKARGRIARQVRWIANLANDILQFTRGDQPAETYGLVDYAGLIHALVEEFQPELRERSVTLELANAPPAIPLSVDPERLGRVFFNLFMNAADALPKGGRILLRFSTTDSEVATEIEDTGTGIAPEIAPRLFEAFATFGKAKGTGLGLAIAQRIVHDYQGEIQASNRPGGGAVFRFTLPRQRR